MADNCVFCESEGEFPLEHWVPKWISRAVIEPNQIFEHHNQLGDVWYDRVMDMTVPHVCPTCNHGWMSNIETRARRVALPLIKGEGVISLPEPDQRVLASWCFMKVISLEIGRPPDQPRTYPDYIYTGFRKFRYPPGTSCVVSVGIRDMPSGDPYAWFRSEGNKHTFPILGETPGYRTALVVGHLVIDVFGVLDPRAELHLEDDDPRLTRIWPVTKRPVTLAPERFKDLRSAGLT